MNKKHIHIGHTALAALATCPRLWQLSCLWEVAREDNEYAKMGRLVHKFIKENIGGVSLGDFILREKVEDRKLINTLVMLDGYFKMFAIANSPKGETLVEYPFIVPLEETTKYIFSVSGILDLAIIEGTDTVVIDHKTSHRYKTEDIEAQYMSSIQIPLYIWALRRAGINANYGKYAFILMSKTPPIVYLSEPIKARDKDVEDMLAFAIKAVHDAPENTLWTPMGRASGACSKCSFLPICNAETDEEILQLISARRTPYGEASVDTNPVTD